VRSAPWPSWSPPFAVPRQPPRLRLKEPIEFDAPDNKPVSLVFVLLVPEAATGEHLALLSHLARLFNEKSVREALRSCQTPEEARALLLA